MANRKAYCEVGEAVSRTRLISLIYDHLQSVSDEESHIRLEKIGFGFFRKKHQYGTMVRRLDYTPTMSLQFDEIKLIGPRLRRL